MHASSDSLTAPHLRRRIDALAACSDEAGAVTRLFLSPAHARAVALVRGWMEEAGMTTTLDDAGTLVGRYEGETPGLPALLLGSHIDSVHDAGRFDGTLGVVLAVAVVDALSRAGQRLPFAIEVLAFGDEEGVRFPATLAGSRAIAGLFDPAALDGRDRAGISLREALEDFGCDPSAIPALARPRPGALAYLEVHIEQATALEDAGQPLGVVLGISGAARLRFALDGRSGHAGTLPMDRRADALCGAAEIVLFVESLAKATPGLYATVGRIEAMPGAVNVVPGQATFTLDIRALDDGLRRASLEQILERAAAIAAGRGLRLAHETTYDQATTPCDPHLMEALSGAIRRRGWAPLDLPSGAGHDGLAVAALCPIAMLFVRCRGGISHHPDEEVGDDDLEAAAAVLLDVIAAGRDGWLAPALQRVAALSPSDQR